MPPQAGGAMSRLLPLMVAQVLPLPLSDGSPDFADQVTALLDDFPNTRLAIYAEPHLLICSGTCSFDRMERLIATARV